MGSRDDEEEGFEVADGGGRVVLDERGNSCWARRVGSECG